jgi:hypothetical protein
MRGKSLSRPCAVYLVTMLTRRRFVLLVGGGAMVLAAGCGDDIHPARGGFLDEHQWATLDAASELVLPGARAARAVRYIDQLLTGLELAPPRVYAGGPFSGRRGYPDTMGRETLFFPPDGFAAFLSLARVDELAWRARIDGWRALYPQVVDELDRAAAAIDANRPALVLLAPADQARALAAFALAAPEDWQVLVEHVLEGTLAAPEYGGNADLVGWRLAGYDGDSAPLGYSFFDAAAGVARERPDQPTSGPSPADGDEDLDPDLLELLAQAAIASGGKRFA